MAHIVIVGAGIDTGGAKRIHPERNEVELNNGAASLTYDYLVIATGPKLAFDDVQGL
jgi:sulfide:quinone oxidoreductase